MMRCLPLQFTVAGLTLLLCLPGQSQINHNQTQTSRFSPVLAPRELSQHLVKARKALEEGDYALMCERLESVLSSDEPDGFFGDRLHREGLRRATQEFCYRLQGEARDAFELKFGSAAQQALDKALQSKDLRAVEAVAKRFAGTRAGVDAALLTARRRLDQAAPRAAAAILEPICRLIPWTADLEPELSLSLALAWRQAGKEGRCLEALKRLHQQAPQQLSIGGEEAPWVSDVVELGQWADRWLPKCELVQTTVVAASPPPGERPLSLQWVSPMPEYDATDELLRELQQQFAESSQPALPHPQALEAGKWLVARNAHRILGLAPDGGKRTWIYPHDVNESSPGRLVTPGGGKANRTLTPEGMDLMRRIYVDRPYASISTDGKHLFFLEDLANPKYEGPYSHYLTLLPTRRDGKFLDPNRNRLIALDLAREGALAWRLGGDDSSHEDLKETYFLGSPVLDSGVLYVQGERQDKIELLALEADTGKLIWSQTLVNLGNAKIGSDFARRYDNARITFHDDGIVCWTAAEHVVGLGFSGDLHWQANLASKSADGDQENSDDQSLAEEKGPIDILPARLNGLMGRSQYYSQVLEVAQKMTPGDRWANVSLICEGGRCLVTPPDRDEVFCLDLTSGEILWRRRRGDFLYVGCCHRGGVLLVGRYRLGWLDLETGKPRLQDFPFLALPSAGIPSGRGVLWGEEYWIPTSERELVQVNLTNGRVAVRAVQEELGNLTVIQNRLVSQSPTTLTAYVASPVGQEEETIPVAQVAPDVAELIQQLGAAQFVQRENAEKQLRKMGLDVMESVAQAAKSSDPEVRLRASRLLVTLRKDSLMAMVERFRKGEQEDLPGWSNFKEIVGEAEDTRKLFCDIFESEGDLLRPLEKDDLDETAQAALVRARTCSKPCPLNTNPSSRKSRRWFSSRLCAPKAKSSSWSPRYASRITFNKR